MFQRFKRFVAEKCARALSPYMDKEFAAYRADMGFASGTTLTAGQFNDRSALGVASFYSAVKLISEVAASLHLQVQSRIPGTELWEAVVDHDLEWLLNEAPNPIQTGTAFQRLRYTHRLCNGRSGTVIRWKEGRPVALWPMHRSAYEPFDDPALGRMYQVQFGVSREMVDLSEFIDVIDMTVDGVTELSPIRQFASNLSLATGTRDQASAFYANQPKPGLIVQTKKKLPDDKYKDLKTQLDTSYRANQSGRSMLLEGDYEIKQFESLTFADYQLLEILAQNDTDIGEKIFNLPPRDLKGWERVEHLEKYVLGPFLLHDAQALSRQLPATVDLRKLRIRHDLRGLVEIDIKTRYESYRVGIMSGFIKINEVRGLLNLPPDPKGDELYLPQSVYGKPGSTPVVNPMKGSGRSDSPPSESRSDPASAAAIEARRLDQGELPLTVNPEFHGILTDVLSGLFTREQHFAARAAKKPAEWRSEVERWYGEHESTVRERLRHMPDARSRVILDVIGQHRAQLLDLSGSIDLSTEAQRVSALWPQFAGPLALTLLES